MPKHTVGNVKTGMDVYDKPPKTPSRTEIGRGTSSTGVPGQTTRLTYKPDEIKKR